jgi:hypothetical protein
MAFNSAFDHFQHIADVIRKTGTYAIATQEIINWKMEEVQKGTLIGTVPYSDGTVFHLSIGSYESGTSYPDKFGAHVTFPNGTKCVWFDWNQNSNPKHQNPHVQFSDNPKKRLIISDQQNWTEICDTIQHLKNSCGTLPNDKTGSI